MINLEDLPALNATLNGISAALLVTGFAFIRRGNVRAHTTCMLSALVTSALFLTSYLIYHFQHPSTPFPGSGVWRTVYFWILIPHIILAIVMIPMILTVLYRAMRGRFDKHKRLARITLPIWLYVSLTGVVVYVMLYRIAWES